MLVRIGRVVLLGDVVAEEEIGERLEAVRVVARDVDGDRVVVADVLGERLAGLAVEDDDARHALQADEEVVLAALVVVEAADHAAAREGDVRLRASASAAGSRAAARRTSRARPRSAAAGSGGGPSITRACSRRCASIRAPISRQRLLRARVLPPAADAVAGERAPLGVVAVDVGDLELAARGRAAGRG